MSNARLIAHRGLATWGEKLVPLGDFHAAAQTKGRALSAAERELSGFEGYRGSGPVRIEPSADQGRELRRPHREPR